MVKKMPQLDQLQVHALADRQLEQEERDILLAQLEQDNELKQLFCDINQLKAMVKHAYEQPQPSQHSFYSWGYKAAAILVLVAVGFIAGWLFSQREPLQFEALQVHADADPHKILLYIGESDPYQFAQLLKEADQILNQYQEAEIYIVTSAGGVDLLRTSTTPFQKNIAELKQKHDGLHLVACNRTLFNLKKKGQPIRLVKGVEIAPSAVEFVLERLKQGWTYIEPS